MLGSSVGRRLAAMCVKKQKTAPSMGITYLGEDGGDGLLERGQQK